MIIHKILSGSYFEDEMVFSEIALTYQTTDSKQFLTA